MDSSTDQVSVQCVLDTMVAEVESIEASHQKSSKVNGWYVFYREVCPKLVEEAEKENIQPPTFGELSKIASMNWKRLSEEERIEYNRIGQKEREDIDLGLAEPKTCKKCGKIYIKNNDYRFHEKNCGTLDCNKCGKSFASSTALRRHEKRYINDFSCTICKKTLSTLQSLQRHEASHSLEGKKYKCKCGAKYGSKQSLVRHQNKGCKL